MRNPSEAMAGFHSPLNYVSFLPPRGGFLVGTPLQTRAPRLGKRGGRVWRRSLQEGTRLG
jgi:hypothetical protein